MKGFRWWTKLRMRLAMWLIQDYVRSTDLQLKVLCEMVQDVAGDLKSHHTYINDIDKAVAVVRVQVDNFNTPDIDYEKLAQKVNVQEVGDYIDYQSLAADIDSAEIAEHIDIDEIAREVDVSHVEENILDALIERIRQAMR